MSKKSDTFFDFGISEKMFDRNHNSCTRVLDGGRYLQIDVFRLMATLMEGVKVMELQSKTGTGHTKYYPVIDKEVLAFFRIDVIYRCITVMKEYENKSLEELRFEDYESERKGKETILQTVSNSIQKAGPDDPMLTERSIFREGFFRPTPFRSTTRGVLFGSASEATDGGDVSTNRNGEEPLGFTTRDFNFGTTAATNTAGGFNFDTTAATTTAGGFNFGTTTATTAFGGFGFGNTTSSPGKSVSFGTTSKTGTAGGFRTKHVLKKAEKGILQSTKSTTKTGGSFFQSTPTTNIFNPIPATNTTVKDIFGSNQTANPTSGSVFGSASTTSTAVKDTFASSQSSASVFGSFPTTNTTAKDVFWVKQTATPTAGSIFGSAITTSTDIKDVFVSNQTVSPTAGSVFESVKTSTVIKDNFVSNQTVSPTAGNLFGSVPKTSTTVKDSFGSTETASTNGGSVFESTIFPMGSNNTFKESATTCQIFGSNTQLSLDTSGQTSTGTTPVRYEPTVGLDTVIGFGGPKCVDVKFQCITCMKEYENKSIEELRLEDYVAGRKPSGMMEGSQWQKIRTKPLPIDSNNLKNTEHIQCTKSSSGEEEPKEMNACIQLKEEVARLSERLITVSVNNEHFEAVLDKMSSKVSMVNDQINELFRDKQTTVSNTELGILKEQIHAQTQLLLRNEVEIDGIPETRNEKLLDIIYKIGSKLGIDIQETDIDWVIRETTDVLDTFINGPTSLIVVRFVRGLKKYELIEGRKATTLTLEDLNLGDSTQTVFVNEHLTHANRLIFRKARQLVKLATFRHCWTENGRTYIRQEEGTPAVQIKTYEDFLNIKNSSRILYARPEIPATSTTSVSTPPLDAIADKLVTSSDLKVEKLVSSSTSPSNPKVGKT